MEILAILLFSSYAFGAVFIICELCQRVSNQCDDVGDIIGQAKWYLFPAKIQRILPLIIANVQEEVFVECFGSIACNRETFKRVNSLLLARLLYICLCMQRILSISGDPWGIFVVYDFS